jgi:DNA-binding XRE family transcriptional regulator
MGPMPGSDRPGRRDPAPYPHSSELRALIARLRRERLRRGLSLGDVSRATHQARSAISRLENGRYPNPTLDTVYRYASALGWHIRLTTEPGAGGDGARPRGT